MFETAAGITLPFPEKIKEEYQLKEDTIVFNLSFEKLYSFIEAFYQKLPEPYFLAIHPDAEDENTVYYLDGISRKYLSMIFNGFGEILLQDGLSSFAIASHDTNEEIFVQKYKVISIYSPDVQKFEPLLNEYEIAPTNKLITPWDTFSEQTPGKAERLEIAGQTIETVIEELKKIGMYQG